jgi:hypothetical protein
MRLLDKIGKKSYIFIAVSVFIFNILDALFTMYFVKRGAKELNPLMDYLLNIDYGLFFIVKMILGLVFFIVVIHSMNKGYCEKFLKVSFMGVFILYFILVINHIGIAIWSLTCG